MKEICAFQLWHLQKSMQTNEKWFKSLNASWDVWKLRCLRIEMLENCQKFNWKCDMLKRSQKLKIVIHKTKDLINFLWSKLLSVTSILSYIVFLLSVLLKIRKLLKQEQNEFLYSENY